MNCLHRYLAARQHELRYKPLAYVLPHLALLTAGLVAWSFWAAISAVLQ